MSKARQNHPVLFEHKEVRRVWRQEKWYFSIIDVVAVLTESTIARRYWSDLKRKLIQEGYRELYEKIVQLKMLSSDGKFYLTDCADIESLFRIIQSIPSPKAEPFKRWLAKVAKERLDEIENPELAMDRMKSIYEKKGYPKSWIDKRLRGIAVRHDLTDEWDERGAQNSLDYAFLTNEIMEAAFDMSVDGYKKLKKLGRENLRDHIK